MTKHAALHVESFIEASFQENAYLTWEDGQADAWIIDPGFPPQTDEIIEAVRRHKLQPVAVLITHAHPDHIAGVAAIRAAYPDLPLVGPRDEQHMCRDPQANLSAMMGLELVVPEFDQPIALGDTLKLGSLTWKVLDVAGHSPGGVAYYCPAAGVVFTGDALFAGSIGRTDFPGSSHERLLDNIRQNLYALPADTVVYSGHGPETTIRREQQTNPFVQGGLD